MKAVFLCLYLSDLVTNFQLVRIGKKIVRDFWALPQGSGFSLNLLPKKQKDTAAIPNAN